MVWMHVRDDHPQHGQAIELLDENGFPIRSRLRVVNAAIDHRPAFAPVDTVTYQPEIDMVQHKGKRHAQPFHSRGNFHGATGGRKLVAPGVIQGALKFSGVHL